MFDLDHLSEIDSGLERLNDRARDAIAMAEDARCQSESLRAASFELKVRTEQTRTMVERSPRQMATCLRATEGGRG